jgi:hypothetical protein
MVGDGRRAETLPTNDQELTAPDRAITTVAGAVPSDAENRPLEAVVHHTGEDMSQVMRYPLDG